MLAVLLSRISVALIKQCLLQKSSGFLLCSEAQSGFSQQNFDTLPSQKWCFSVAKSEIHSNMRVLEHYERQRQKKLFNFASGLVWQS